ncbi:hypothetical protein SELMODRAFT_445059 [Selaginella moellendorffii]|uniref:Uncharacterized protein n=1 Tax=Selaginella moellendorffii TaxID=88036 RepID=D8SF83_SELML|nr:hypothetical protein SELMODRAFT_445059 [Selaginella moellendorffii]
MGVISYFTGCRGATGFGSGATAEKVAKGISLESKVVIVTATGATSGIGFETARVLAKHGAHVVIPARKLQNAEAAKSKIQREFPNARVTVLELDLSSLKSVRKFVDDFKALNLPLHILINNAGMTANNFQLSPDGLELDFATNHMGPFLLTELLLDKMIQTASQTGVQGRIVMVASEGHRYVPKGGIEFDKLNDKNSFQWITSYGRSKLANILHTRELASRLKDKGANVTVNSLHPGTIKTNLGRDFNQTSAKLLLFLASPLCKSIPQGAATTMLLAVHPCMEGVSGKYYLDCNEADCTPHAKDMKLAAELWTFSEEFIKSHP